MIYNFLVDTSIYADKSDFTLNLLNPIIITEKERLRFKLINFSSLNNIYNISSELNNNTFNVKRYKKLLIYVRNPLLTTSPIISQNDTLLYYNTTTHLPLNSVARHTTYNNLGGVNYLVEEVVLANYTLYLRDGRITEADTSPETLYFYNMFLDNPSNNIAFMIPFFNNNKVADKIFIINKPSGFTDQLNRVEIDMFFYLNNHNNPDTGVITTEVCRVDFTTGALTIIGTKNEQYTVAQMAADNTRRITINVTADPNIKETTYIVRFTTAGFKTEAKTQFYLKKLNFIRDDFGYFQESGDVILDEDIDITIPDGIYGSKFL
jgi:hypothetical protein